MIMYKLKLLCFLDDGLMFIIDTKRGIFVKLLLISVVAILTQVDG